jgi:hypothetical protein|tara:strand:- start:119 stop:355 length:237 start_codon:yes stop_codon:yes gene_type:complete
MKTQLTLIAVFALAAAPVFADHGNPWASEGDTVLSKNHETNQVKSIDTPGEDEMRGAMVQNARGKLDGPGRSGAQGGR